MDKSRVRDRQNFEVDPFSFEMITERNFKDKLSVIAIA